MWLVKSLKNVKPNKIFWKAWPSKLIYFDAIYHVQRYFVKKNVWKSIYCDFLMFGTGLYHWYLIFGEWQLGGFEINMKSTYWCIDLVKKFVFIVLAIESSGVVCEIVSDFWYWVALLVLTTYTWYFFFLFFGFPGNLTIIFHWAGPETDS